MRPFTTRVPAGVAFRRIRIVVILVLFGTALLPNTARGQTGAPEPGATGAHNTPTTDGDADIKKLMQTGISEYRKNHLEAARAAFEGAWKLKHHSAIAASLADVEMKLGRYREAAEHWEYYLGSSPPDRADAEAQLADCSKHLGRIGVSVEPEAAEVLVDGEEVERSSPAASIWVNPGEHTLSARFEDRLSSDQKIAIGPGERKAIVLKVLAPITTASTPIVATPTSPVSTAPHEAHDAPRQNNAARTWTLIGGGVASAVALGVGIGYTVSANGLESDATQLRLVTEQAGDPELVMQHRECAPPPGISAPPACAQLQSTVNQINSERNIALVAYSVSGVLAVATVATFFLWPSDRSERSAKVQWTLSPISGGAGVHILGNF